MSFYNDKKSLMKNANANYKTKSNDVKNKKIYKPKENNKIISLSSTSTSKLINPYLSLPFYKCRSQVVESIIQHPVSAVSASTGSGKSLSLPLFAAEALEVLQYNSKRIFITVPTVMAAKNLERYQKQYKEIHGLEVGYAAGGEIHYINSMTDMVVYCTTGHLVERILNQLKKSSDSPQKALEFADVIIIDEAHIKTQENYILSCLMRYLLSSNTEDKKDDKKEEKEKEQQSKETMTSSSSLALSDSKSKSLSSHLPRLIFSSGTLDIKEDVQEFFASPNVIQFEEARFPVTIQFHSRNYELFTDTKELQMDMINIMLKIHREVDLDEDILVFLAGSNQIEQMIESMETIPDFNDSCEILPLYSSLSPDEQDRVLNTKQVDVQGRYRRIILATNVAESSVTINGISYVIDSMMEKILKPATSSDQPNQVDNSSSSSSNTNVLSVQYITKSSSKQRQGRIGRTKPGTYIAMCNESFFNRLPANNSSAFHRTPIFQVILRFLESGLDGQRILNIPSTRYNHALKELLEMEMIYVITNKNGDNDKDDGNKEIKNERKEETKYELTESGRICPQLPISLRNALWLYKTIQIESETHKALKIESGSVNSNPPVKTWIHSFISSMNFEGASSGLVYASDLVIILVSILEAVANNSIFVIPRRIKGEANGAYQDRVHSHKETHFDRFKGESDFDTLLEIFLCFKNEYLTTYNLSSSSSSSSSKDNKNDQINQYIERLNYKLLKQWCRKNHINYKVISQAYNNRFRLLHQLNKLKLIVVDRDYESRFVFNQYTYHEETFELVKLAFQKAYPNNVCINTSRKIGGPIVFVDQSNLLYFVNNRINWSNQNLRTKKEIWVYSKVQVQSVEGKRSNFLNYVFG